MSAEQVNAGTPFQLSKMIQKMMIILPIGLLINLAFALGGSDRDVWMKLTNFSPGYFALAILMVMLPWFANTLRLFIWTRFLGTKLTFLQTFRIILISEFGAAITPSAVGSAPVKTALLIQEKMASGAALSLATITTFEDLAFFVVAIPMALTLSAAWHLPFLGAFYDRLHTNLIWFAASILMLCIIIWLTIAVFPKFKTRKINAPANHSLSFMQRIKSKGKNVLIEFKSACMLIAKRGKRRFMATSILTGFQWICRYSVITALVASLGLAADPVLFFVLQWLVFTLSVFIPTPGASGGAEASFYLIFAPFLPHRSLGLLTTGWRFLVFYLFLGIGVLVYFLLYLVETVMKKTFHEPELILAE